MKISKYEINKYENKIMARGEKEQTKVGMSTTEYYSKKVK